MVAEECHFWKGHVLVLESPQPWPSIVKIITQKKSFLKLPWGGVQPHYVAIAVIDGSRWAKRFYKPGNVMKLISSYFRDSDKDRFHLTKNYYMSGQLSWK